MFASPLKKSALSQAGKSLKSLSNDQYLEHFKPPSNQRLRESPSPPKPVGLNDPVSIDRFDSRNIHNKEVVPLKRERKIGDLMSGKISSSSKKIPTQLRPSKWDGTDDSLLIKVGAEGNQQNSRIQKPLSHQHSFGEFQSNHNSIDDKFLDSLSKK